jgi:uncharacterized repeat protein (TIGR04076 family)
MGNLKEMLYEVMVEVIEVRGHCAVGYKTGDKFTVKGFYIEPVEGMAKVCIHALTSMISLLSPFLHGVSARLLGIGEKDDEGYLQCPDPGKPYTCGGTVIFKLKRRAF